MTPNELHRTLRRRMLIDNYVRAYISGDNERAVDLLARMDADAVCTALIKLSRLRSAGETLLWKASKMEGGQR